MAKTSHRRALKDAEKRGMVEKEALEALMPLHRRYCYACGGTFLPPNHGNKGFCCGHCAKAWGDAVEKDPSLRQAGVDVEVIYYPDGQLGVIHKIVSDSHALVRMKDGREIMVHASEVDPVLYLMVEHAGTCHKATARTFSRYMKTKQIGPQEDTDADNVQAASQAEEG